MEIEIHNVGRFFSDIDVFKLFVCGFQFSSLETEKIIKIFACGSEAITRNS